MNISKYVDDIINTTISNVESTIKCLNEYDNATIFYRECRLKEIDPITYEKPEHPYSYPYEWDPYTGEITKEDINGPINFDPINILNYFYHNKLNNLWVSLSHDEYNFYDGYYGELVGIGKDINIVPKGKCPEKYLFRVPLNNCYLKKNYDRSVITSSPKLTNKDIVQIDNIIQKYYSHTNEYKNKYKKITSLLYLKTIYDLAISKEPSNEDYSILWDFEDLSDINNEIIVPDKNYYLNRLAVEAIKQM
jgi:hypothetical protein